MAGRTLSRRKLLSLVGILFAGASLLFIGYLVYRERDTLVTYLLQMDARQLLAVTGWYLADLAVYITGWALIMNGLGGRVRYADHARIFCLANVAKRLPGTLWYVGGRVALYNQMHIAARVVLLASAIEGALLWISGLVISVPILIVVFPERRWIWLALSALVLVALLNPKTLRWVLRRATKNDASPNTALLPVYLWVLVYMAGWLVGGLFLAAVAAIFSAPSSEQLPYVVGTWTVAGTASMLTLFLPSSFGVTEVTLTALLSRVMPLGMAVLVAISARLLTTLLDVILGGLAFLAGILRKAR